MFINNPDQFPSSGGGNIDIGLLATAGLSSTGLNLLKVNVLSLQAAGAAAPSLTPRQKIAINPTAAGAGLASALVNQNFALSPRPNGVGTAALDFGTTNGIKLARTEGIGLASLHFAHEITDTLFAAAGAADVEALFRLNDDANLFLDNATAAGSSDVQLSLSTEQLLFFRTEGKAQVNFNFALELVHPDPILSAIAANPFQGVSKGVLLVNGSEVKIKSFQFSRPRGNAGSSLSIQLAKADLSLIPKDAVYKFQIKKTVAGVTTFYTLLDNARLDGRSYALAFLNDTLNFTAVEPNADRINLSPNKNLIIFDGSRIDVPINLEPVYDSNGFQIETLLRNISVLSLYQVLNIAFLEGCGFSEIRTNLPNFQITRCDFTINSTFLDAIRPLIGIFDPIIFVRGNTLWIIDKTQPIPDDFAPQALPASKITNYSANIKSSRNIDGYEIQYLASSYGTVTFRENSFSDDFDTGSVSTLQKFREIKDDDGRLLDSQLIFESKETIAGGQTVQSETTDLTLDSQGRVTESLTTIEARIPDPDNNFVIGLTKVKEKSKKYQYSTDPNNSQRMVLYKTIEVTRGLVSIDSTNKQLDKDFKQDFLKGYRGGNITDDMTADFVDIQTVIEAYESKGNGQVQCHTQTIDHLNNTADNTFSDARNGDISINGYRTKVLKLYLYRTGINASNKTRPFAALAGGEVPLFFLYPLAVRELKRELLQPQDSTIEMPGYEETLDIGVYFSIAARSLNLGNFVTEGLTVSGDNNGLTTSIEASEVF